MPVGSSVALLLGTLLIWHLQKGGTLTTDVAIGVIFTAALAIGTLVTPSEDLIEALFGGFQNLTLPAFLVGIPDSRHTHLHLPKPYDSNSDDQSCVRTYRNFGGDTAVYV